MNAQDDLAYAPVVIAVTGLGRGAARGMQHDMMLDLTRGRDGQRLTGQSNQGSYRVTRRPDHLSPGLYAACANAQILPEVEITIRRPSEDDPVVWRTWLVVTLTDVLVTGAVASVEAEAGALETLAFNYMTITWTWRGDGEVCEGSWTRG